MACGWVSSKAGTKKPLTNIPEPLISLPDGEGNARDSRGTCSTTLYPGEMVIRLN